MMTRSEAIERAVREARRYGHDWLVLDNGMGGYCTRMAGLADEEAEAVVKVEFVSHTGQVVRIVELH